MGLRIWVVSGFVTLFFGMLASMFGDTPGMFDTVILWHVIVMVIKQS